MGPLAPPSLQICDDDKGDAELEALSTVLLDALVHVPRITNDS